jgi:hypothetical protein
MSWDDRIGDRDDGAYDRLAAHLERFAVDSERRVQRRRDCATSGLGAADALPGWTGPNADAFTGHRDVVKRQVSESFVDEGGDRDLRLVNEMAVAARDLARSIRDVRQLWQDKSGREKVQANTIDAVYGLVTHDLYAPPADHPTVNQAAQRFRQWDALCERAAVQFQARAFRYERLLPPGPALYASGTTMTARAFGARDALRREWVDKAVAHLRSLGDDVDRIRAWWAGLSADERKAILDAHPELLDGPLAAAVTAGDRNLVAQAQRERGRQAGDELRELLRANGIDPDAFDARRLLTLDPDNAAYRQLLDFLDRHAPGLLADPERAVGFFSRLGPDGTPAVIALLRMHARQDRARSDRLVDQYTTALGRNAGRSELGAVRSKLLSGDPATNEVLDLVLTGDAATYDVDFTVAAARVLVFDGDTIIRSPNAYRALARNPAAARRFLINDDGTANRPAVRALTTSGAHSETPEARDAAQALANVIFDDPQGRGSDRVYMAVVEEVAKGGSPAEVKRVAAKSLGFYVDDIGRGAELQMEFNPPPGAKDVAGFFLHRKDLVAFFREIGSDDKSVEYATAVMVARGGDITRHVPVGSRFNDKPVDPNHDANVAGLRRIALIATTAEKGWEGARKDRIESAKLTGLRTGANAIASTVAGFSDARLPVGSYVAQPSTIFITKAVNTAIDEKEKELVEKAAASAPNPVAANTEIFGTMRDEVAARARQADPTIASDLSDLEILDGRVAADPVADALKDRYQQARVARR